GPYAAELRASNPKTGIPAAGPSLSPLSSEELSGRPKSRSITDIKHPPWWPEPYHIAGCPTLRIGESHRWYVFDKRYLTGPAARGILCGMRNPAENDELDRAKAR